MWLVINIGCIECRVSSNVVGLFADKDEAERIADLLTEKMEEREGGENAFEVFPLPAPGVIADEYLRSVSG